MTLQLTLGLSYAGSYGLTFVDFVQKAAALGFSAVQLTPDQAPNLYDSFSRAELTELRACLRDHGLRVHVHNVFYDINLVSLVPEVQQAAFAITRSVLAFGEAVGAESLTVHPGYMFGGWRQDPIQRERFWLNASVAMKRLGGVAKEFGIPILLENGSYYICTATGDVRTPLHLAISPEEFRSLILMGDGGLQGCLDINKALRSGFGVNAFVGDGQILVGQCQVSSVERHARDVAAVLLTLGANRAEVTVVLEGGATAAVADREAIRELAAEHRWQVH